VDLAGLRILVVNAGSTSLKLHVVDAEDNAARVESLAAAREDVDAVAHRVVHGGELREPAVIDDELAATLQTLVELAPLHNAPAVEAIAEARRELPQVPHIAVFDTAFHFTIPDVASTYALPERWRRDIRRYGFHGLSVQWASEQVSVPRLVVCHLGGGCSVTAVRDGRSVDTTMGWTPLEGLPGATRSGSVDPGALLYLARHGTPPGELDRVLEHESGLAALGGLDEQLGFTVFTYLVAKAVAAMATALGGLDALVFTAGIGENRADVRAAVADRLSFLGVALDDARNVAAEPDAEVGAGQVRVAVIHAREEIVAARAARRVAADLPAWT
jgi:acetate kinase